MAGCFYETINRWRLVLNFWPNKIKHPTFGREITMRSFTQKINKQNSPHNNVCNIHIEGKNSFKSKVLVLFIYFNNCEAYPFLGLVSWPWHQSPALQLWCRCGQTVAGDGPPGPPRLWLCRQAGAWLPPATHLHSGGQRKMLIFTGGQGPVFTFAT